MREQPCPNMNHGRMNASVRHCPNCGKVVNISAPAGCNQTKHLSLMKSRFTFCTDCGKKLKP